LIRRKIINTPARIAVLIALTVAVAAVLLVKDRPDATVCCPGVASATGTPEACRPTDAAPETTGAAEVPRATVVQVALPKLLDLGAGTCIPCKKMAPILDELGEELKGRLTVQFIDIRENPKAVDEYGIRTIPTQILFDENCAELGRNEGFISKADILAWAKEKGIDLTPPATEPQE
jgi:thioredoxin 1